MERKSFSEKVHAIVRTIPAGKTLSYGAVAERAGSPRAARAVGTILRKNNDPKTPCHRVIRADGTPGEYNRGAEEKVKKLRAEGVLLAVLLCWSSMGYAKQHKRAAPAQKKESGTRSIGSVIGSGSFRLEGNYVVSRGGISMSAATKQVFAEGSQVRGSLGNSQLLQAKLTRLDMQGLDFSTANLSGASFDYTELKGAKLSKAQVKGAHFDKSYGLTAQQKQDLKKRGASVSMQDPKPIGVVAAASRNDLAQVLQLLKSGADVNEVNGAGNTGVVFAIDNKNEAMLRELLQHKAQVNITIQDNLTPLMFATMTGWARGIELLCVHGADVRVVHPEARTSLVHLAIINHPEVASILIAHGAPIDAIDRNGKTPLIYAILNGHVGLAKELLAAHANPNFVTESGETPLMFAAYMGNKVLVEELLKQGADPAWADQDSVDAAKVASVHGHPEIAEFIAKWQR